jgi:hypothetical protein
LGEKVMKKTLSILSVASLVTGAVLWFGTPRVLAAGGAQGRAAATALDPTRPRPGRRVKKFGPFDTREEALEKKRELEHDGWHCFIKKHHHKFWVIAWKKDR